MKLHHHLPAEEPIMLRVVDEINKILSDACSNGLSLSGGLNCLIHAVTMTLVSAYADNDKRLRVAADIPDVVKAYIPQWEKIIAAAANGERGKSS